MLSEERDELALEVRDVVDDSAPNNISVPEGGLIDEMGPGIHEVIANPE